MKTNVVRSSFPNSDSAPGVPGADRIGVGGELPVATAFPAPVSAVPLCVDLDGTLVKSDTLMDSVMMLVRTHPARLLQFPSWLAGGKASFKRHIVATVNIEVANLPFNRKLLDFLEEEHARGRRIYLATGADSGLAERVADHLGIFDGVLASDGHTNRTGNHKLAAIEERFASFDYIGNASPDLPLLRKANQAMLANPDELLRLRLRSSHVAIERQFIDRRPLLRALIREIRVHQWAKNLLIFLPLLLSHSLRTGSVLRCVLAFSCFSSCASATYIVNDLLDLDADRRHSRKRHRPFAAGDLSVLSGIVMAAILAALAFLGAQWLPVQFLAWLAIYAVTTLAYSLYIKRLALADVLVLSGLYTLRVLAGGAAVSVAISPWLGAFSVFLFLSLAMVKRFSELQNLREAGTIPRNGRGYLLADIEQLRSFGTSSGYAAVIVFTLYISGHDVAPLYHHPERMWLIIPLMIWWINRVWLYASRGTLNEDPLIFALTDRMSLLTGAMIGIIALVAM